MHALTGLPKIALSLYLLDTRLVDVKWATVGIVTSKAAETILALGERQICFLIIIDFF